MATIAEFSYGGDSSGVEALMTDLQAKIVAAVEAVRELSSVNTALDANWVGKSQEKFKENLKNDAENVAETAAKLFGGLSTEINSVMSAMEDNDMHMFG